MAAAFLINNVRGTFGILYAGTAIDDASAQAALVIQAGGLLIPATNAIVAAAALQAQALRRRGGDADEAAQLMNAALDSSQESQVSALLGSIQVAGATFGSGVATISAGITVTADTDAFVVMSTVIAGSVNVGGVAHLKASNAVGGPGVGAVTLNILGSDGAVDADAAGDFRVLLIG